MENINVLFWIAPAASILALAFAYICQQDYVSARNALSQAVRWNPMNCAYRLDLAELFRALDDTQEWAALSHSVIERASDARSAARAYANLGEFFLDAHNALAASGCARTAQRLADYIPYESNKNKRVLFDNITYKDYEIVEKQPAASVAAPAPITRTAPVYAPVTAPVTAPAEDDAMPTARTMGTLQRASVRAAEAEGQAGVRSVLSLRAKIVLGAIAAAIVLFIALICVNTGILSAANAEAAAKEARLQELRETYAEMQEDLDYLMSDEYIDAWAEANGMIRGN